MAIKLRLPPSKLRFMNEDDEKFLRIGRENLQLLLRFGFGNDSDILDIGSGYGRLGYAIMDEFDFHGTYLGLDVLKGHIEWCQANITRSNSRFQFRRILVQNDRYNPDKGQRAQDFCFPVPTASIDYCALFSVFTHMYDREIERYLDEIWRVTRPNGVIVATFFLFDAERIERLRQRKSGLTMAYELNDQTRYHNPADRLHAIAFSRDWVSDLVRQKGFALLEVIGGHWAGDPSTYYQDQIIIRKPESL